MTLKLILLALLVFSLQLRLTADTLLLSYGVTNRITLAEGEVLRFDMVKADNLGLDLLITQGSQISVFYASKGHCIAGPLDVLLTVPNSRQFISPISALVVTFTKFRHSSMRTVMLGSGETNKLTLDGGKDFTLYSSSLPWSDIGVGVFALRDSYRAVIGDHPGWKAPFIVHGPLMIEMVGYTYGPFDCPVGNQNSFSCAFPMKLAVTYSISDRSVSGLPSGSVQVPGGPATLAIEKSTDLINWEPSVLQTIQVPDEKAFFRLRVDK